MQVLHELEQLEQEPGMAEIAVVGAGYAGVELATTVAERMGQRAQVKLITAGKSLIADTPCEDWQ